MFEIGELLKYRKEILDSSRDEDGFIHQQRLLSQVLPSMLNTKIVDTEDYNESYYSEPVDDLKINGYVVSEFGERLIIYLVDENTIDEVLPEESLLISQKKDYEKQFKRSVRFIRKAIKGHLNNETQDSDPVRPLVSQLASVEGLHQFDVIQIFLISLSATVSFRGGAPQPRTIHFADDEIPISYSFKKEQRKKKWLIKKRLLI